MDSFYKRQIYIRVSITIVTLLYIGQLAYLQLINTEYKRKGISISNHEVVKIAPRGLVYDRNGKLLVNNTSNFALAVVPRIAHKKGLDTVLLANLLDIPKDDLAKRLQKAYRRNRAYFKDVTIFNNLTPMQHARIKEHLYKFKGFSIKRTEGRSYNYPSLSHTTGYVKEVNDRELKADNYYRMGDYIGKAGIEKVYEKELRGEKGAAYFLQDNKQRIVGRYKNGSKDVPTVPGSSLHLSIDINLQEYAMQLMQNKRGAVIAIEPSTGELLVKLSSPTFNLDSLYGRNGGKYYQKLNADKANKPLFDRTILAQYPPGSIFKLMNAAVGLQEGLITPYYRKYCNGGAYVGSFFMHCHHHYSPVEIYSSIQNSCNPFYANVFVDLLHNPKYNSVQEAFKQWHTYLSSFGLGEKLGSDFPEQVQGNLPTVEYYNKKLKRKNWVALNIVSVSIGQGELMITPLQMANMVTTIANRGYYYLPHVVKSIGDKAARPEFLEKHETGIDKENFDIIIKGMEQVVFVAFAPIEKPKIAVLVYVENGVWGGRYAAPISGLLIEKYLNDSISPAKKYLEKRMMETSLIPEPEILEKNDSIE